MWKFFCACAITFSAAMLVMHAVEKDTHCEKLPAMEDRKPQFITRQNKTNTTFVMPFSLMAAADHPKCKYTYLKSEISHKLENSTVQEIILPTNTYQSIFVHVSSGTANVTIKMCSDAEKIFGGEVIYGWNTIALDFPTLLAITNCRNFSMDADRPVVEFSGTAEIGVWKDERFIIGQEIRHIFAIVCNTTSVLIVVFVVFVVLVSVYDVATKRRVEEMKSSMIV